MAAAPVKLDIPPGVVRRGTSLTSRGRYFDINHVRFRNGIPQAWDGWYKAVDEQLVGYCRGSLAWNTLSSQAIVHTGTATKCYAITDAVRDITPLRDSGTLGSNPFATTSGSAVVTVTDTAHGLEDGATAIFDGASAFNNVTIDGPYLVTVVNTDSYTITAATTANATGSGGGASVAYEYEINPGLADSGLGLGVGVGPVGDDTVGTPRDVSEGIAITGRHWSFSRYGDFMAICPSGDTIYLWDQPADADRAVAVSGAPYNVRFMFVTAEGYIFALGGDDGPMVLRWPARDDPTDWNPDILDDGNARRLQVGSALMAGCKVGDSLNLIWSDQACYVAQYTGDSFVYATPVAGTNCGIIGSGAFAATPVGALWMGAEDFFLYQGGVQYVPNRLDVRDYVYGRLNRSAAAKITCTYDRMNNSTIWSYPAGSSLEPNEYVEVSHDDWSWSFGDWMDGNRTAMCCFEAPTGDVMMLGDDAGGEGYLYVHNAPGSDADGVALPWSIETGLVSLSDGMADAELDYFQPDFEVQAGDVTLEITTYDHPQDLIEANPLEEASYTIAEGDSIIDVDVSGRYLTLRLSAEAVGSAWRGGLSQFIAGTGGMAQ